MSSWSWRNLIPAGTLGGGQNQAANAALGAGGLDGIDGLSDWTEIPDNPFDLPNMLGLENFGNTCYVNSVMQALWFCDPFRESILAYLSATASEQLANADDAAIEGPVAGPSSGVSPSKNAQQKRETTETVSLLGALQTLFEHMGMASTSTQSGAQSQSTEASQAGQQPAPSSNLGGTLSRKVSARPGTGGARGAANSMTSTSSAGSGLAANASGTTGSGPNATGQSASVSSNVLVPDADIKAFLLALKKSNILFDSTAHQDAHELLNHVLNAIGDDIVNETRARKGIETVQNGRHTVLDVTPGNKTFVHRLFEGVLTNETRCLTCETVTSRDESFLDLSLDIERNMSVSACLQQFSASEMLCARNKFFCDTCSGLQEAEKRMKIKKQPNVLALHLKRFKYEESMGRFVKLAYRVVFPMELRLNNISDDADEPDKLYRLYGLIVHIGQGPHHGHYVAILRISTRWFLFDDETIRIIDEEDIARYYGDAAGPGSAYVLFYQAVDLDLESLGLPNLYQMRLESARKRREDKRSAQAPPLKRSASQEAQTEAMANAFALPSRTGTPAEGKSSLFSRRAFNLSSSSSHAAAPVAGVGLAGATAALGTPHDAVSPLPESGKSSWLSSLRPRKASVSTAQPSPSSTTLSPSAQPNANGVRDLPATSPVKAGSKARDGQDQSDSAPPMISSSPSHLEDGEDARSVATSSAASGPHMQVPGEAHLSRQRSPARSAHSDQSGPRTASPHPPPLPSAEDGAPTTSARSQPSRANTAGAAWAPADRPLSKKEQNFIAKQSSRRASLGTSSVNSAGAGSMAPASQPMGMSSSSSSSHRLFSGLGIGSPPRKGAPVQGVTSPSDASPASETGAHRPVSATEAKSVDGGLHNGGSGLGSRMFGSVGARGRRASVRRPTTAGPTVHAPPAGTGVQAAAAAAAPSAVTSSPPTQDVDSVGVGPAPGIASTNSGAQLGRRRTTLSRAFGLMRGAKDKDAEKG